MNIDAAKAICMAEDGDARIALYIANQLIRAAWDNQIDRLFEG
jgi:hypothetical protein